MHTDASPLTDDIDALFEQVATQRDQAPVDAMTTTAAAGDVITAAEHASATAAVPILPVVALTPTDVSSAATPATDSELLDRIGRLTRNLHESLQQLGYDRAVNRAADALPDARDRLNYIASLTGKAAERTLNTIELAKPVQEAMGEDAAALARRWADALQATQLPGPLRELAASTHEFLGDVQSHTRQTGDHLLEIMMAQDFHDLTGQVIKKVISLATDVEEQLVALLRQSTALPAAPITTIDTDMNGPVIDPSIRTDVVDGQEQVDDLLARLGF